jgi:hypothetical protein
MGAVEFGLPQRLVADLARALNISVAIETGTYKGASARALATSFERVISIELSPPLYEAAKQTLDDLPHVEVLNGSSADLLRAVTSELTAPAIYWLDGHWCGDDESGGDTLQCPVIAEIEAIDAGEWAAQSCILIDDARLHLGPPPPPFRRTDWPTITEVVDKLRAVHDRVFTVLDDVIVAGPPTMQAAIDTYWLEKQWRGILSERNELRDRLWFPSVSDASRLAAKALRARKLR